MRTGRMLSMLVALLLLVSGCTKQATPTSKAEPVHNPPATVTSTGFWDPDNPKQLPPTAWGKVDPAHTMMNVPPGASEPLPPAKVAKFTLATTLPSNVPSQLPVYMTGVYPSSHRSKYHGPNDWGYEPQLSLVGGGEAHPIATPPGPDVATRAAALLKQYDLLMPDSEQPTVRTLPQGTAVMFFRRLQGMPVYGDKPACVQADASGTINYVVIRRRPLVEASLYPTRSPQEAWTDLTHGAYIQPSDWVCEDASSQFLSGPVAEFRVTAVELAYWERHVDTPVQAMLPYYVFRSDDNATLYVPAIKPEWVAQPTITP